MIGMPMSMPKASSAEALWSWRGSTTRRQNLLKQSSAGTVVSMSSHAGQNTKLTGWNAFEDLDDVDPLDRPRVVDPIVTPPIPR